MRDIAARSESGGYGLPKVCAGIVGHADLRLGDVLDEVLSAEIAASDGRLRGIRHSARWDPSMGKYRRRAAVNTARNAAGQSVPGQRQRLLPQFGLTYESWQFHTQLGELATFARAVPQTTIVLDHMGGVLGTGAYAGNIAEIFPARQADIRNLARCPNVVVKLGGLGMTMCGFGFDTAAVPATSTELAQAWKPSPKPASKPSADRSMFRKQFPWTSHPAAMPRCGTRSSASPRAILPMRKPRCSVAPGGLNDPIAASDTFVIWARPTASCSTPRTSSR